MVLLWLGESCGGFDTFDDAHCGVKLISELLWVQIVNIHGIHGSLHRHLSKLVVSSSADLEYSILC